MKRSHFLCLSVVLDLVKTLGDRASSNGGKAKKTDNSFGQI